MDEAGWIIALLFDLAFLEQPGYLGIMDRSVLVYPRYALTNESHRRSLLDTRLVSAVDEAWTMPSDAPFRFLAGEPLISGLLSESPTLTSTSSSFGVAKATAVVTSVLIFTSPSSSVTSTSTFFVAARRSAKDLKFAVKSTL